MSDDPNFIPDDEFLDRLNIGNTINDVKANRIKTRDKIELLKTMPENDQELEVEIINNIRELMAQNTEMLEDLMVKIESGADVFFSDAYSKVSKAQADALKMYIDLYASIRKNKVSREIAELNASNRLELADKKALEAPKEGNVGNVMTREDMMAIIIQAASQQSQQKQATAKVIENTAVDDK
jgi:hypothetical protein